MSDPPLKRLELRLRRGVIATVSRAARRPRLGGVLELPENPRILLLRHDRLGDAIVATPVMKLLRERFPDARIEVLLGHRNAPVASLLPAIDDTLLLGRGLRGLRSITRTLRPRRYDVVVNLLANDSASGALLAVLSGARYRVGFAGALADIYDFAVPRPTHPMHIVSETSHLLGPFGIAPIGESPRREAEMLELLIPRGAEPVVARDTPRVAISISAGSAERMYPDEETAELARLLTGSGITVDIAGAPAHRGRLEAIARESGAGTVSPTDSFAEFVARLSRYDVIVTPQTSTVHVGSAIGRATVLLNTSSRSDQQWTPWGVPSRVLARGELISMIPPTEVADAVRSLLGELRAARAWITL